MLGIARTVFRERGHVATTREIARPRESLKPFFIKGLAQGSALFAATGPRARTSNCCWPRRSRRETAGLTRKLSVPGEHFAEVILMALQVMMHPSSDRANSLSQAAHPCPRIAGTQAQVAEGRGEVHLLNAVTRGCS